MEAYSAFGAGARPGLGAKLQSDGMEHLVVVGLAFDYCVGETALDAAKLGAFESVTVVADLTRSVSDSGATEMARPPCHHALPGRWLTQRRPNACKRRG